MTLKEFKEKYSNLNDEKTSTIDKFCKKLIKDNVDVSFLKDEVEKTGNYYYVYQQVSIKIRKTLDEKFEFIESNFEWMNDWYHTDGIMKFLGNELDFEYAYKKASRYVKSDLPYTRRLGYVIFIPRLTKDKNNMDKLIKLLKNDEHYHVIMGEAWLISFLAMCDSNRIYNYLKTCDLRYNIVGKAIQKICDSYVISEENKERFKSLRKERKLIR